MHTQLFFAILCKVKEISWADPARRPDSRLHLFYKIIHGLVAIDLPPYTVHPIKILKSQSHDLCFHQIHTRVDFYEYSFYPIVQWNLLPQNITAHFWLFQMKWAVCHAINASTLFLTSHCQNQTFYWWHCQMTFIHQDLWCFWLNILTCHLLIHLY